MTTTSASVGGKISVVSGEGGVRRSGRGWVQLEEDILLGKHLRWIIKGSVLSGPGMEKVVGAGWVTSMRSSGRDLTFTYREQLGDGPFGGPPLRWSEQTTVSLHGYGGRENIPTITKWYSDTVAALEEERMALEEEAELSALLKPLVDVDISAFQTITKSERLNDRGHLSKQGECDQPHHGLDFHRPWQDGYDERSRLYSFWIDTEGDGLGDHHIICGPCVRRFLHPGEFANDNLLHHVNGNIWLIFSPTLPSLRP